MTIGYEVIGTGPLKVIVLSSWLGDHNIWSPTYPFLDRQKISYAFLDYRGYGISRGHEGEQTMKEISSDAIALADHLDWAKFSLIGHSMGGMAVQRVGVDAGSRVQSIVCVTPVPASGVPLPPEFNQMLENVVSSDEAARMFIDQLLGKRLTPTVTDYILRQIRSTTTPDAFSHYYTAWSKTDFSAEAKRIKCPILVLIGEHDGIVTADFVRASFPPLYPHAQIEIIPNSGHFPVLETPAYLVTRVEEFLSKYE